MEPKLFFRRETGLYRTPHEVFYGYPKQNILQELILAFTAALEGQQWRLILAG